MPYRKAKNKISKASLLREGDRNKNLKLCASIFWGSCGGGRSFLHKSIITKSHTIQG